MVSVGLLLTMASAVMAAVGPAADRGYDAAPPHPDYVTAEVVLDLSAEARLRHPQLFALNNSFAREEIWRADNLAAAMNAATGGIQNASYGPGNGFGLHAASALRIDVWQSDRPARLHVSLSGRDADGGVAARAVNYLAQRFAESCRAQLADQSRQIYMSAHAAADLARAETVRARSELDAYTVGYFKRQVEAAPQSMRQAPPESLPAAPAPALRETQQAARQIENPQWTAAWRQLQDLRQRCDTLLTKRTPQHPEVQDALASITEVERQMASLPRWIAVSAAAVPMDRLPTVASLPAAPPRPDAAAADEARRAAQQYEAIKQRLQRAVAAEDAAAAQERAALQWSTHLPEVHVALAKLPVVVAAAVRPRSGQTWLVAAAFTALSGLGMLIVARGADQRLATAAQALGTIDLPLVGVVGVAQSSLDVCRPIWRERGSWHVLVACGVMALGGAILLAVAALALKFI